MMTQFTYQGVWWLPESPDEQVTGNLTFSPDEGAELNLIGSLKSERRFGLATMPEIILGITVNGKPVTLYQCYEKNTTLSSGGIMKTDYIVTIIFIGHHFENAESIVFHHMYFRFAYLEEWLDMQTITKKAGRYVWSIKHRKPKRIELISANDCEITIASTTKSTSDIISAKIESKYYIGVMYKQERHFTEFIEIMTKLQNLISLCVLRTAPPVEIDGRTGEASYISGRKRRYTPIEVHYRLPIPADIKKKVLTNDMLFSFQQMSGRTSDILQNWLQRTEILRPMYSLYFGTIHNTRMYTEHEFLNLMQALEFYHRATMPGFELSEDEHRERITQIISNTPEKYKKWLESKLTYSNEINLRKRLKQIAGAYAGVIGNILDSRFIDLIVNTRNYYTHYNEELKDKIAKRDELPTVNAKLDLVVKACLMKEMGFDLPEIRDMMHKNRHTKQLL